MQHGDQVRADGIHLGVKFAAHHAVAEIDQACAGIALDFAARIFERLENDDALWLFDFFRCAAANIENGGRAFLRFVKSLPPAGQNFFDDHWQRASFFLQLPGKRLHADRIHDLERPEFPGKAPAQRAIDVHNVVGNFRHASGCVQTHLGKRAPQKLLGFVAFLAFQQRSHQRTQPLPGVLDGFPHFERSEFRFLSRTVLHGVHIEGQNFFLAFTPHLFVKTLPGLVAKPAALGHLFDKRWNFVALPRLVIRRRFVNVLHHVDQHVETDNIRRAKRRRLRPAHRWTRAGIHFFHSHAQRSHQPQRVEHGKRSDAIGDEVRRVLCNDHAFAKPPVAKFA